MRNANLAIAVLALTYAFIVRNYLLLLILVVINFVKV